MSLLMKRLWSDEFGTRSQWIFEARHYCYILEPQVVKLPSGTYQLNRFFSPKHNFDVMRYEIPGNDVFNNRGLEVHPGNVYADTEGCSLPGDTLGLVNMQRRNLGIIPGILNSTLMFQRIMHDFGTGIQITVLQ